MKEKEEYKEGMLKEVQETIDGVQNIFFFTLEEISQAGEKYSKININTEKVHRFFQVRQ